MKFPFSWLKEILPEVKDAEKIAQILTLLGIEVEATFPLKNGDVIFETSITPNLVHSASIIGMARELSSFTGASIQMPRVSFTEKEEKKIDLSIKDPALAPRYLSRLLFGVKVGPSPDWLVKRLESCDLRSINNVVDVTNLIMLEQGHPLHAFDFDKIEGGKIIVRKAAPQETITTLDGKKYCLDEEVLVIADAKGPIAIAGIMGGMRAEISESTKIVVLESAYFDAKSVRRSAKKLGIHTGASYLFERGVDPNNLEKALDRAATVLQEIKGVSFISPLMEKSAQTFHPKHLSCRLSRLNKVLGTKLVLGEMEAIFKKLFFSIVSVAGDTIIVSIPTYRNDLKEEIDLIEEVARLYGFDHIFKKDQTVFYQESTISHHPLYHFGKKVRFHLLTEGLQELLTCNLISPEEAELVSFAFPKRTLIKIINPTSALHSVMRPSLLPNLLNVVKENAHHNIHDVLGFELGKVHFSYKGELKEQMAVALIWTGMRAPFYWQSKPLACDIFDLKGILENLFKALHIECVKFQPSALDHFHPARQAKIIGEDHREMGIMGQIHPSFLKKIGIQEEAFFAELSLEDLFAFSVKTVKMKALPLFPGSMRDWTVTVSKNMLVGDLMQSIEEEKSEILEEVLLLDVYESAAIGLDKKNVTFRFNYRDQEKTVSFEEVEKEHERIIKKVCQKVNI